MSTSPDEPESPREQGGASAAEVEALANEFVALLDEFEAGITSGQVPPEFAERLVELRQAAERLIDE